MQRVDDALYELESTMNAGNQNATAGYLLSQIEKAAFSATEFATSFNNFIADGPSSHQAQIIKTVATFAGSISDVLSNSKGITRFVPDDKNVEIIITTARHSAEATIKFFQNVQSFRIDSLDENQKSDVVIANNLEVQAILQKLTKLVEQYIGNKAKLSDLNKDLGEHVDNELGKAAAMIEAATARLAQLQQKSKEPGYSTYEIRIHEYANTHMFVSMLIDYDRSILDAAIAVTNAIAQLIKAATISQQEVISVF